METTVQAVREENVNHRRWIIGTVIAAIFGAIQLLLGGLTAGQQAAMTSLTPPQIIYVQPPSVGAQPGSEFAPQPEQRSLKEQPPR